jgi:hypothetical protein
MSEFHHELRKRKPGHEDNWHFDTTWLTSDDFLRRPESFSWDPARDEAITLLKAKFDYIRDIMKDASMPEVQRMIERFLKGGPNRI